MHFQLDRLAGLEFVGRGIQALAGGRRALGRPEESRGPKREFKGRYLTLALGCAARLATLLRPVGRSTAGNLCFM